MQSFSSESSIFLVQFEALNPFRNGDIQFKPLFLCSSSFFSFFLFHITETDFSPGGTSDETSYPHSQDQEQPESCFIEFWITMLGYLYRLLFTWRSIYWQRHARLE